ncbi:aminotransferase class I/II-fold pyridoxal phosphate-dependent enzyme [bacterium]|mgnify:CR=1 FL=1|nr:aminotransferase class I/II-fold pyridoxal phosphate-dependent enzyme [bacterium]HPF35883.1 aminotransferase class I/II-fold pyridoxal phosphate-dependent enzyme [Candidatus Krumholzibacteria bacterium]HRX51674.1 aminotransferase class I/II-fold pyridoxal phosphate-dependent enzyme [Candidatus Krumholzibacteria bacterium]
MPRLDKLPPYLFTSIDKAKREALAQGRDVVDLGIGDPDRPTPRALVDVMAEAVRKEAYHRYPSNQGSAALRETVAAWFAKRHGVTLDPASQILALIGSKEGIAHLPLALMEEGDEALVPDVGYPVYPGSTILTGGVPVTYPLTAEGAFRPDPRDIAQRMSDRTRLVMVNSPHNPTGAAVDADGWRALLDAVAGHDAVLANDGAYLEVGFGGPKPVSLLSVADASRDRVIEFHSLSKTFNMTGWRIGFAVGHAEVIGALDRVKQNIDSGAFTAVQDVAIHALEHDAELVPDVMSVYPERRAVIVAALEEAGVEVFPSDASFYVWARVPRGGDALEFCARVLREHAVVVTPGVGFGPGGAGWFRISLTAPDDRIREGARRLRSL